MIKVLFVDDEPDIIEVARLYLEKDPGISVTPAYSGGSAIELMKENGPFDVIVSDHEMPGMDGLALLNTLRKEGDETPFIMYTGRSREQVVIEALNSGAFFLLQKGGVSPKAQFIEMGDVIAKAVGRKRALDNVRKSEERYRLLAESAHDAIFIQDLQGVLTYINTYGASVFGREPGQIVGKCLEDLFPGSVTDEFRSGMAVVMNTGLPHSLISRIPGKDGEIWLETWLVPIKGDDSRTFEIMGLSRDISERMAMEEAVRASELKCRTLLDQAPDAIFITDPLSSRILEVNRQACLITGRSQEELIGMNVEAILSEKERKTWMVHVGALREGPVPVLSGVHVRNCKSGEIPVDISCTPVLIGENAYHQVVVRDMTEWNRTMLLLEQQQKQLEATNRELEAFSYSVSHDLRAPARVIEGYSTILLEKHGNEVNPEMRHILERIMAATRKMQNLISDLLSLSRVSNAEFKSERVDMSVIARGIADDLLSQDPGGRHVEFIITPGMSIRGDKALIEVMLRNLIENSWKYTQHTSNPRIEVGMINDPEKAPVFFIRDNGAGFDAASARDLFSPFKRFHSESEFPGTGIGLAIVQRIVHRHRGEIHAESVPGKGAVFFFEFV